MDKTFSLVTDKKFIKKQTYKKRIIKSKYKTIVLNSFLLCDNSKVIFKS